MVRLIILILNKFKIWAFLREIHAIWSKNLGIVTEINRTIIRIANFCVNLRFNFNFTLVVQTQSVKNVVMNVFYNLIIDFILARTFRTV